MDQEITNFLSEINVGYEMYKVKLVIRGLFLMLASSFALRTSAMEDMYTSEQSQFTREEIRMLNEKNILSEKQKLRTKFHRNVWLRNGLSAAAALGAIGMFMAWSTGDIKYTFKDGQNDQQTFLDNFNQLPAHQRYEILIKHTVNDESHSLFSGRTLTDIVSYALGTASSTLVFNILQTLIQNPFGKFVDTLYYQVNLEWFLTSQSHIAELFEALHATAQALSVDNKYQLIMFIDLINTLTMQMERLLGLMHYELESFKINNIVLHNIGKNAAQQLKDVYTACIDTLLNDSVVDGHMYMQTVDHLKEEFDIVVKQFHSFEAACN